jgi:hypothetical protein
MKKIILTTIVSASVLASSAFAIPFNPVLFKVITKAMEVSLKADCANYAIDFVSTTEADLIVNCKLKKSVIEQIDSNVSDSCSVTPTPKNKTVKLAFRCNKS